MDDARTCELLRSLPNAYHWEARQVRGQAVARKTTKKTAVRTKKVSRRGGGRKPTTSSSASGTSKGRGGSRAALEEAAGSAGSHLPAGETERLERLVRSLGNNRVADLMDVSASQPSRWRRGKEQMGSVSRRRLIDLDYVWGRLLQLYPERQAKTWMSSPNAHLGARPIDVLRVRGAGPVIDAIDAEEEGAFA
jgi:uncharacterized protein (DUF2384 family)